MGGNHGAVGGRRIVRLGRVIYGADREIADWVGKRIPGFVVSDDAVALGVIRGGKVVAGVVYERCNGANIEASIAATPGSAWADRDTLRRLFEYPYLQLGVEAVTVLVALDNLPSLGLAVKLGFSQVALIPFAARGGAPLVVLQQYRDQCRWLRHGQGKQRTAAA